jgi:hypothetical protein
MSEPGQNAAQGTDRDETTLLIAEYEFARDNRNQSDAIEWEMTAIVWGGQTLLLGFVLEAIGHREAQLLIVFVGVLGLVMSLFNYKVVRTRNSVCNLLNHICRQIEERMLSMRYKPQTRLDEKYEKGIQTRWFDIVNCAFIVVWLVVITAAMCLFLRHDPLHLILDSAARNS